MSPYGPLRRRLAVACGLLASASFGTLVGASRSTTAPLALSPVVALPVERLLPRTTTTAAAPRQHAARPQARPMGSGGGVVAEPPPASTSFGATGASVIVTTTTSPPSPSLRPPVPGRYTYQERVDGQEGQSVLVVDPDGSQTEIRGGRSRLDRVSWTATARRVTASDWGDGTACTWSPPLLTLALPLTAGQAWDANSTCTASGRAEQRETADVKGRTTVQLDGASMEAWLIERRTTVTETDADGSVATVEQQSSELFAPTIGLVVYRTAKTAVPRPDGTVEESDVVSQLVTGHPG
ncbi:MAG TPA: hypothetical protein VF954_07585 [Acidimicrobiales bacterium]